MTETGRTRTFKPTKPNVRKRITTQTFEGYDRNVLKRPTYDVV
jgi:hypothetical protein